jgi:hypothetical protein
LPHEDWRKKFYPSPENNSRIRDALQVMMDWMAEEINKARADERDNRDEFAPDACGTNQFSRGRDDA